jgi:hypothetical protein
VCPPPYTVNYSANSLIYFWFTVKFCFVLHRAPGYIGIHQGAGATTTQLFRGIYALGYLVITLPQPLALKPRDEDGVIKW